MLNRKHHLDADTIAALATPPGRGGVAVIRVSGPLVHTILVAVLNKHLKPRLATYSPFFDADGSILDEGLAIYFPGPHSFTGEDVLELHGHGGPVVNDLLLQRLISLGARLSRPGEFSLRAFLNEKMDLSQAEAIADLIDASSAQAVRLALRSLQGAFSQDIKALNQQIIQLRTYVEAAIDFSDEEIDFLTESSLQQKLDRIKNQLQYIRSQAQQGSLLREGIQVVIIGKPNVGKSSLLNLLSGKELAIVTAIPGTTRDVLRDSIVIDGIPLHIIDTAGLRESEDVVEQEGIRRAHQEIEKADLILWIEDASQTDEGDSLSFTLPSHIPCIRVRNKIDLLDQKPSLHSQAQYATVALSAKTGEGVELLKEAIKMKCGYQAATEGLYLARRRHLTALDQTASHLDEAWHLLDKQALELSAEELRLAHAALSEITGEFHSDDLLGHIFSSFCIGK